jgi:hypothetical protein
MSDPLVISGIDILRKRAFLQGGFAARDHSSYRTDATAWAVLALLAAGQFPDLINLSRARLAQDQLADGRLGISPDDPEAFWPTPLAILAWCQSAAQQEAQARAVHFLLSTTGKHWPRRPDEAVGHDTNIKGWPWIEGTHSWVGSTGIIIIALQAAGSGTHERVAEAVRLLMDRQLPSGGWNFGNTFVFGTELRPMPESTGIALNALKNRTARASLQRSLDYLKSIIPTVRTPCSLAWGLLGLGAWGERPPESRSLIAACLKRQERYGSYDTTSLSLLLLALMSPAGLDDLFPGNQDAKGVAAAPKGGLL